MYITAEAGAPSRTLLLLKFGTIFFHHIFFHLLPPSSTTAPEESPNTEFVFELAKLIQEASGFEECYQENVQKYLKCDVSGRQLLTDNEIFSTLKEDQIPSEDHEEEEDYSDEEV